MFLTPSDCILRINSAQVTSRDVGRLAVDPEIPTVATALSCLGISVGLRLVAMLGGSTVGVVEGVVSMGKLVGRLFETEAVGGVKGVVDSEFGLAL